MSISEKLKDSNLSPQDEEAIIGAFVRRQKREALEERWAKKLSSQHNIKRSHLRIAGENPPRQRLRLRWILPTVAAALLLLILLLPQLQRNSETRSEVLAVIMEDTEIDVLRSDTNNDFEDLQVTFAQQYNTGNYTAAIATGEQLLANPAAQQQDRLHLGLAYLNADVVSEAAQIFEALLVDPFYRTEATFYLATTRFNQGQEAEALTLLESIQSDDGKAWYRKAQRVLSARVLSAE